MLRVYTITIKGIDLGLCPWLMKKIIRLTRRSFGGKIATACTLLLIPKIAFAIS